VSVSDQDQLKVWDLQLAKFGATIIRQRLDLLAELLPKAERFQEHISGRREKLSAEYLFSARESEGGRSEQGEGEGEGDEAPIPIDQLGRSDEGAIAQSILRILRQKRAEEIARKQTVVGPHRDDITFSLNGTSAVDFASQGQQRSLVLALKLAELEQVTEVLSEPPVLLLDDVLAELDLNRQGLLMSLVNDNMQTLITTTHVDGFKPEWLEGALFLQVKDGAIASSTTAQAAVISR
jgi:DNA replication and repair protein RecF